MQTYEIIFGFSNIKLQLIEKCRLTKTAQELSLWFTSSAADTEIYVHDSEDHNKNMIVALTENGGWRHYLKPESVGLRTVDYILHDNDAEGDTPAAKLNFSYNSLGYFTKR